MEVILTIKELPGVRVRVRFDVCLNDNEMKFVEEIKEELHVNLEHQYPGGERVW